MGNVNITLSLPENLKDELKKRKEVNWSAVMRNALVNHLVKLRLADAIASKSKFTKKDVEELDKIVKRGIAKSHGI